MNFDQFVEHMRQEIREEGFMSGVSLAARTVLRGKEAKFLTDCDRVLAAIPCDDIRTVEYANSQTVEYRRKTLYYFNPDPQ